VKSKIISALKLLIFLAIGVLLIWLVIRNLSADDKQKILIAFHNASYGWVVLAIVISFASNIFRALRWRMLLRPMNHNPSLFNISCAVFVAYLANTAFPRLGEVSRCGILNKYEKIPLNQSLGTVVTERIIDTLTLLVLILVLVLTQFQLLSNYLNQYIFTPFLQKLNGIAEGKIIIAALLVFTLGFLGLVWRFRHKILQIPFVDKIWKVMLGFLEGVKSIQYVKNKYLFVLYSLLVWFMYFLSILVNFQVLETTANLGSDPALAILVFGSFAYIAVQGGIGAYPLIVQGVLILYGIDKNIGYAWGWINWSGTTLSIIVFGFLALLLLSFNKTKNESSKMSDHIE
jgi:uncharacterized protein (TIRG00374 family)